MTVIVDYQFVDREGRTMSGSKRLEVPGTRITNALALGLAQHFLEWASTDIDGAVISVIGRVEGTGRQLFSSEFARSDPPPPPALAASD